MTNIGLYEDIAEGFRMARRKSKAKQEEEFFQGVAGLAAMGLALGGYYLTKTLQGL